MFLVFTLERVGWQTEKNLWVSSITTFVLYVSSRPQNLTGVARFCEKRLGICLKYRRANKAAEPGSALVQHFYCEGWKVAEKPCRGRHFSVGRLNENRLRRSKQTTHKLTAAEVVTVRNREKSDLIYTTSYVNISDNQVSLKICHGDVSQRGFL